MQVQFLLGMLGRAPDKESWASKSKSQPTEYQYWHDTTCRHRSKPLREGTGLKATNMNRNAAEVRRHLP